MNRRTFVKGTLSVAALAAAAGAGLLSPSRVLASYPAMAFDKDDEADALKELFGDSASEPSDKIELKAPLQAENGAVVPVKVSTTLDADTIAFIVEKNPSPLATLLTTSGAGGLYSARIKMGETSKVTAYVRSGGKVYSASQEIKVTVGGCGG